MIMEYELIRGYKVVHDMDLERAKKLVEWFLDCDVRCTDDKHAIVKINDIRIRFKYEGMKREHIEIKELTKKSK